MSGPLRQYRRNSTMANRVLCLVVFVLASCSQPHEPDPPDIGANLVYSVEAELFNRQNTLVMGSDGVVYTTDLDGFGIRKYGATGDLVAQVGSRGEGPSEFSRGPSMITYAKGHVTAASQFRRTMHVFDRHLKYVGRYTLDDFIIEAVAYREALYFPAVVVSEDGQVRFEILHRHHDGTKTSLFSVGERIEGMQDSRGLTFSTGDLAVDGNVMVYAYTFRNAIEIYAVDDLESGPVTTRLPGKLPTVEWERRPASSPLPMGASGVATMGVAVDRGQVFVLGGGAL